MRQLLCCRGGDDEAVRRPVCRCEKGMSKLGYLLLVLLIALTVLVGSQVFPFYYYFYELQGLMESQAAKASVFTDQEIRQELMRKIKKLEIPISDPDDLKINRFSGKITIDLSYSETLYIDLGEDRVYDLWEFKFNPHAEHALAR